MAYYLRGLWQRNWHVFAAFFLLTCFVGIVFGQTPGDAASEAAPPGPDVATIKMWLSSPLVLFVFMIVGSLVSMVKQWGVAKMDGSTTTFRDYLTHLPEVITTLFGNAVAFFGLVMTDSLNFVSAISIGYVISSAADLLPNGSRSTSLTKKE